MKFGTSIEIAVVKPTPVTKTATIISTGKTSIKGPTTKDPRIDITALEVNTRLAIVVDTLVYFATSTIVGPTTPLRSPC